MQITNMKEKYSEKVTLNISKKKNKGKNIYYYNVGKMFVSDTPCPWQKIAESIRS